MMAAFSSTLRPGLFLKEPRYSSYYSDGSDEDLFVDCVDKQLDVFDFLEIERDDTSVSLSSSSSSSSLELSDDTSYYSNGSTVYLDALDDDSLSDEESDFSQTSRDVLHESLPLTILPSSERMTGRFEDHPEREENRVDQECQEGNPISHAIHFAHNLWEGSKHTPVGFAVHMTEAVVGGVLGNLVGLVHHHDNEERMPSVEEQLAPFSRDYPLGQHAVFTLDSAGNHSTSEGGSSDDQDWLPLE